MAAKCTPFASEGRDDAAVLFVMTPVWNDGSVGLAMRC